MHESGGGYRLRSGEGLRIALLIALVGFQLRAVIVGVAPVLPQIRDDLHLSFSAAGALTAIPVLSLGAAAIPGAHLVNRFGARAVVALATAGIGLAALLRLAPPEPLSLFLFSALMALCVAVVQPALAVFIRACFPTAIQRASTVYATSLGIGGLCGATLSVPLLFVAGWRGTFVAWAMPILAAACLWFLVVPRRGGRAVESGRILELAREPAVWRVAGLFGAQSLVYYGTSTWLPFDLREAGPGTLTGALLVLNLINLPLAAVLLLLRRPWATSRAFYAASGVMMLAGSLGFAFGLTGMAWFWAGLLSVSIGMTFTGAMALPPLLARRTGDVAGFSAIVLTAGYALAFMGPLAGGVLLDHVHRTSVPFWIHAAAALAIVCLGLTLPGVPPRLNRPERTAGAPAEAAVSPAAAAPPAGSFR